ncbi:MAG: hypothetical protein SOW44_01410 [Porphyromonas sp.]|nr:hypothetical protein [Bacteroidales bacterium]MDY3099991.1 hypothetical protein [Porphyromonas sp.]
MDKILDDCGRWVYDYSPFDFADPTVYGDERDNWDEADWEYPDLAEYYSNYAPEEIVKEALKLAEGDELRKEIMQIIQLSEDGESISEPCEKTCKLAENQKDVADLLGYAAYKEEFY